MIQHETISYISRDGKDLLLDIRMPDTPTDTPRPAIVFVHGGGWLGGDRSFTGNEWLARAGFFTASISYRFTDVARFPAQIHDVKAAIRWVRANAEKYTVDPDRIGVWGSSAGGHLTALCAVTNDDPWYDGEGNEGFSSAVQAAVPICPPTDFLIDWYAVGAMPIHIDASYCINSFLGGDILDDIKLARQASPLWQVHGAAAPQLIIHGAQDDLVPVGQARAYAAALRHHGAPVEYVEYPREAHGVDAGIYLCNPQPLDLRRQITAFFRTHLIE